MKHNKLLACLVAAMSIVTMSACGPTSNPTSTPSVDPTVDPTVEPTTNPTTAPTTSTIGPNEGEKTNADFQYARTTYLDDEGNEWPLTRNTLYTNSGDHTLIVHNLKEFSLFQLVSTIQLMQIFKHQKKSNKLKQHSLQQMKKWQILVVGNQ